MTAETGNSQPLSLLQALQYAGRVTVYKITRGALPRLPDAPPTRYLDRTPLDLMGDPDFEMMQVADQKMIDDRNTQHGA